VLRGVQFCGCCDGLWRCRSKCRIHCGRPPTAIIAPSTTGPRRWN
jgi:hypothetical protein